jgi:hypothetical protein
VHRAAGVGAGQSFLITSTQLASLALGGREFGCAAACKVKVNVFMDSSIYIYICVCDSSGGKGKGNLQHLRLVEDVHP